MAPPNHDQNGWCSFISHMRRDTSCPGSNLQSTQTGRTSTEQRVPLANQYPSTTGTSTAYGYHPRRWRNTQTADDRHGERQTRTLGMDCSPLCSQPMWLHRLSAPSSASAKSGPASPGFGGPGDVTHRQAGGEPFPSRGDIAIPTLRRATVSVAPSRDHVQGDWNSTTALGLGFR